MAFRFAVFRGSSSIGVPFFALLGREVGFTQEGVTNGGTIVHCPRRGKEERPGKEATRVPLSRAPAGGGCRVSALRVEGIPRVTANCGDGYHEWVVYQKSWVEGEKLPS
jgi:hypothetical protein